MYITIEGIDTAGKSTQIQNVSENFENTILTKEPGATGIGNKIRDIVLFDDVSSPIAEVLLFLADRSEHLEQVIKPNLDKMIFSDRSLVSGIAYALISEQFSLEELISLNQFATQGIIPDYVFILKLTREELENRLSFKQADKIESRGIDYLLNIQEALITAVKALKLNYFIIDASQEREAITQQITQLIKENNG